MLSPVEIKAICGRFESDYASYYELGANLQQFVADALLRAAIKHMVSFRVKSPASLEPQRI